MRALLRVRRSLHVTVITNIGARVRDIIVFKWRRSPSALTLCEERSEAARLRGRPLHIGKIPLGQAAVLSLCVVRSAGGSPPAQSAEC